MKKNIITSIILGILGGAVIGAGIWGKFYASADILTPYSDTLIQISWIAIIVGVIAIAASLLFFVLAIRLSEKKEK